MTFLVNPESNIPIYEQIYRYLKSEIQNGNLVYQTKLPSGRELAEDLSVSRNTVSLAYDQLVSEGYLEARPKSGYYVCKISELYLTPGSVTGNTVMVQNKPKEYEYDFSPFSVDITCFPFATWRKLYSQSINDLNNQMLRLGCNQGDYELRKQISDYLHHSRGVICSPEQILIGAGNDYLLQLLCQVFDHRSIFAMENPSYRKAYQIISGFGFDVKPISVRNDGLDLNELHESGADVVYVTPSHQYPLGVVMPIAKRMELLSWANENEDRFIIEDDHDSEFRYKGKPIPALQGVDFSGRVIYMGTFSRAISPGLRVGYLILPKQFLKRNGERLFGYSSTVSRVEQTVLTNFMKDGYFERHVNKMRKHYKLRHDCLLNCLTQYRDRIEIHGENAGLHLVATFRDGTTNERIQQVAEQQSIAIRTIEEHLIAPVPKQKTTVLFGFSRISEEKIRQGIALLFHCI